MARFLSRKLLIITFLVFINLLLLGLFMRNKEVIVSFENMRELEDFEGNEDFDTLRSYFTDLAKDKGAVYAFEVLKRVEVAPNTDMHLMGHVVGEILYQQEGAGGMQYCTNDFRNACSHTIVVGLFSEKGAGALPEIAEACKKAPGGRGAYNMCFHGLGHGVLAFVGYDIEKAVEICMSIQRAREDGNEAAECVGGVLMEIISGGDHDKELWGIKKQEQMRSGDPLYPCSSSMIPNEAKGMCYTYLTPHLFEFAGGNIGMPTEEDFEKAFEYCRLLPIGNPNRNICFEGFGKEFVGLAKSRDIRQIESLTDEELNMIIGWCSLASEKEGISACHKSAVASMYWGGENTYETPVAFCAMLEEGEGDSCFKALTGMVSYYSLDEADYKNYCKLVVEKYNNNCS